MSISVYVFKRKEISSKCIIAFTNERFYAFTHQHINA